MSKQRVFLLATGCFNPPTIMHLRIMELARDYFRKRGFNVVGGALTPVHDGYGKKDLAPAVHRLQMVKLALNNSDWVKVSSWEASKNSGWTRTRLVVEYHQKVLNDYLNGGSEAASEADWLPDQSSFNSDGKSPIQLKLVCGADLLESFNIPNLWGDEDAIRLVRDYGLIVISREGNDPLKSIYTNDILNENQGNIHLVQEWISNEISSTKIRRAIRRTDSVRYIVPDPVVEYINENRLYSQSEK